MAALPASAAVPAAPLTADALARHPLILYPARPRPSYADHVLSLFRAQGLQSPVSCRKLNELQTALGLVAAGIGITLVPASVQRLHRDDVRYVPVDARRLRLARDHELPRRRYVAVPAAGGGLGDAAERE